MFNMPAGGKKTIKKVKWLQRQQLLHVQIENKILTGTDKMICKTIFVMFLRHTWTSSGRIFRYGDICIDIL